MKEPLSAPIEQAHFEYIIQHQNTLEFLNQFHDLMPHFAPEQVKSNTFAALLYAKPFSHHLKAAQESLRHLAGEMRSYHKHYYEKLGDLLDNLEKSEKTPGASETALLNLQAFLNNTCSRESMEALEKFAKIPAEQGKKLSGLLDKAQSLLETATSKLVKPAADSVQSAGTSDETTTLTDADKDTNPKYPLP